MKPIKYLFLTFILLFICFFNTKTDALETISINDGDYELVCKYADGLQLTIARDGVYIQNASLSIDSSTSNGIKMYLTSEQKNSPKGSNGDIDYKHHAITESSKCPSMLYAYDLPAKYETEDTEDDDDENDTVSTLYYSTKSNVEQQIGGTREVKNGWWIFGSTETVNNATRMSDMDTYLVSEEIYLTTSKETTVCDYQIPDTDSVISIYLYDNITILENSNYISSLPIVWPGCIKPASEGAEKFIYINDPAGKSIAGGTGTKYNSERYYAGENSGNCKTNNDGNKCIKYKYLGTRNSSPGADGNNNALCKVLGDKTVEQLQRIINILQILMPVLMIAITTFDVGKMVISGNLEEELPKKKTIIVVRFCLLAFFFFLPLITGLIIDGLMEAGVVGVKEIDCVLK